MPSCSIAAAVKQAISDQTFDSLLAPELLALLQPITEAQTDVEVEWVQCELLWYPHSVPPLSPSDHPVEQLQPIDDKSRYLLRHFDGGGYCIRADDGTMAAHAWANPQNK